MTAFQLTAITAVLVTVSGAATAQTPDQLALELARSIANQTVSQQAKSASTSNSEETTAAASGNITATTTIYRTSSTPGLYGVGFAVVASGGGQRCELAYNGQAELQ